MTPLEEAAAAYRAEMERYAEHDKEERRLKALAVAAHDALEAHRASIKNEDALKVHHLRHKLCVAAAPGLHES